MEKRIAILENGIVTNIVVGRSAEEIAEIFNCVAVEVTEETEPAHIGYGYADGKFEQKPYEEIYVSVSNPEKSLEDNPELEIESSEPGVAVKQDNTEQVS